MLVQGETFFNLIKIFLLILQGRFHTKNFIKITSTAKQVSLPIELMWMREAQTYFFLIFFFFYSG